MLNIICKNDDLCKTIINLETKGFKINSIEPADGTNYKIIYEERSNG